MKSDVLVRLATILLVTGFASAGPCKPTSAKTTSAISSTASAETSLATSAETTPTEQFTSATSVTSFIASDETSALFTTDLTSTAAAPTTETTSAAAISTFAFVASGESRVKDKSLATFDADDRTVLFNAYPDSAVRTFTIDAQGRISDNLGRFLCSYYSDSYYDPNGPAVVGTCNSENRVQSFFLICRTSASLTVQCSIPARSCVPVDEDLQSTLCEPAPGTWSQFFVSPPNILDYLLIGDGAHVSAGNTPIEMKAQPV
ncbi:uncharacterized protein FTOL_11229 [Fusarium torulosum]|uniref:Uncharacterized protein n=1 Tax=Fusarium torulosum TaxID=33205 RepID=A0AAE8MIG3_9HYPO|nr:uncharacterized protein FTOL_11229 [Fusarium torulosum]